MAEKEESTKDDEKENSTEDAQSLEARAVHSDLELSETRKKSDFCFISPQLS